MNECRPLRNSASPSAKRASWSRPCCMPACACHASNATFAGTAYGHNVTKFFEKLTEGGYASASDCLHNRAALYHVHHQALNRAIGQPHSRYRRPVPARQAIERLMRLDSIVLFPELMYVATEDEKVAFFGVMAPSLPRERLPHITVGKGASQRVRCFLKTSRSE